MILTKIKTIFRIFFSKNITSTDTFENRLKSNNVIRNFKKIESHYIVTLVNGTELKIRNVNFSDIFVFEQIFNFQEYACVLSFVKLNKISKKEKIIIDAGANVGFTSVYFANYFESSKIYAIEPSIENAKVYQENLTYLNNYKNIHLYQKALSHKKNILFSIGKEFRDRKDWSFTTKSDLNGTIEGITIEELIEKHQLKYISLLKIDIEGAERFIFSTESNLDFLKITEILAIEIHDEFKIRDTVYEILRRNKFLLMESGEITIGINKAFIKTDE